MRRDTSMSGCAWPIARAGIRTRSINLNSMFAVGVVSVLFSRLTMEGPVVPCAEYLNYVEKTQLYVEVANCICL